MLRESDAHGLSGVGDFRPWAVVLLVSALYLLLLSENVCEADVGVSLFPMNGRLVGVSADACEDPRILRAVTNRAIVSINRTAAYGAHETDLLAKPVEQQPRWQGKEQL